MPALHELSLGALVAAVDAGSAGPLDAARHSIARIEAFDESINSFVARCPDATAAVPDAGPLRGVPVGVKDVFVDRGRPPTMGSRVHARGLQGTAEVLLRLRRAGAAIVGYTNLHEWAVGTTSIETATGPIRNPWRADHVAGGSSGGSAAALAAGFVTAAVGTDLGGSIRVPAACCGVVGLKPTWGLVPTAGYAGDGGVFDHAGPMARTVADVRAMVEVLAPGDYRERAASELVVGVPDGYFFDDVDREVGRVVDEAIAVLGGRVKDVVAVDVPGVERSRGAIGALALPFLAGLVDDLGERSGDLEPGTAAAFARGMRTSAEDRARALVDRDTVRRAWVGAFEKADVVVTPTIPAPPALIAAKTVELPSGTASADLSYIALNAPMNLAGVPCLSLPCGTTPDGWSVNASLTAAVGRDATVLALGAALEEAFDGAFANRLAPIGAGAT